MATEPRIPEMFIEADTPMTAEQLAEYEHLFLEQGTP
jgi:hypothetical protein